MKKWKSRCIGGRRGIREGKQVCILHKEYQNDLDCNLVSSDSVVYYCTVILCFIRVMLKESVCSSFDVVC